MFPMTRFDSRFNISDIQLVITQTLALAHAHGTTAVLLYRNGDL